ncbi:MAG: hypothetical protein E7380_02840 [Clostridiales bacterium]|nr:hypothetical protein [Clostridiales bacterium]
MRKFLGLLLTGILLFCTVFSIAGCGETEIVDDSSKNSSNGESPMPEPEKIFAGSVCTLEEVYEADGIDRTALLNIAYYSGNAEHNPDELGADFVPIEKGELSEEVSLEIRECLAESARTNEKNPEEDAKAEDYRITEYYGCYNGYYAFFYQELDLDYVYPAVENPIWREIDGVTFYSWTYLEKVIYMWKKTTGSFYSLEEAYENGWLIEEDLEGIADIYNNKKDCAYVAGDLPLNIENSIKHTYLEDLREDVPQAKIENVELRKYYGTYGDCIVVNIYSQDMLCDIRFEDTYIGNVLFRNFGGTYSITVWVADGADNG